MGRQESSSLRPVERLAAGCGARSTTQHRKASRKPISLSLSQEVALRRLNESMSPLLSRRATSHLAGHTAGGCFWRPHRSVSREVITPERRYPRVAGEILLPQLGARVATMSGAKGFVRYAGETQFKSGLWIGIELDEPHGKNDGSVHGFRYFCCPSLHGIFLSPAAVQLISDEDVCADGCAHVGQACTGSDSTARETAREEQDAVASRHGACAMQSPQLAGSTIRCTPDTATPNKFSPQTSYILRDPPSGSPAAAASVQRLSSRVTGQLLQLGYCNYMGSPSPDHQTGVLMREPIMEESINLSEHDSPKQGSDSSSSGEGGAGLKNLYGADWCDPQLYDRPDASCRESRVLEIEKQEQARKWCDSEEPQIEHASCLKYDVNVLAGSITSAAFPQECESFSKQGISSARHETAVSHDSEVSCEVDIMDGRSLIFESIAKLRASAEAAILCAERAEAELGRHRHLAGDGLEKEERSGHGADCLDTMQHEIEKELKEHIAAEVSRGVQAAVKEAMADLRTTIAEVHQLRDELRPGVEMISEVRAATVELREWKEAVRAGIDSSDQEQIRAGLEQQGDCSIDGTEAARMLAMKATIENATMSPDISTDDGARCGSGNASCSSKNTSPVVTPRPEEKNISPPAEFIETVMADSQPTLEEAPLPATSYSLPTAMPAIEEVDYMTEDNLLHVAAYGRHFAASSTGEAAAQIHENCESCSVRDKVDHFEKILPCHNRDPQDFGVALAPWPFAPINRPRKLTAAATPWSTAPCHGLCATTNQQMR